MTEQDISLISAYADNELSGQEKILVETEISANPLLAEELRKIQIVKHTILHKLPNCTTEDHIKARIGAAMMKEFGYDFSLGHKVTPADKIHEFVKRLMR